MYCSSDCDRRAARHRGRPASTPRRSTARPSADAEGGDDARPARATEACAELRARTGATRSGDVTEPGGHEYSDDSDRTEWPIGYRADAPRAVRAPRYCCHDPGQLSTSSTSSPGASCCPSTPMASQPHSPAGRSRGYCGFDPDGAEPARGQPVPVMGLMHLQRAGHRPIALVGGGTGMIGDPSGKSSERRAAVARGRSRRTPRRSRRSSSASSTSRARRPRAWRNNADWLAPLALLDFLRDTGQALHGQLHAGEGLGEVAARRRHLVHRVLVHAAAGVRLPRAAPARWASRCRSAAATSGATSRRASS